MTNVEYSIALLRAAGANPVPGPFDHTWSMDVDGCEIRFSVPPGGVGLSAWWAGLDPRDFVKVESVGVVSALKALVNRLAESRGMPGSAGAARRLNDLVMRMEAV